ncbi:MAG: hypothetical protein NZZ41_02800 [Candidatus Dojkabacteria bacterium]|nr:hypothetical protein [Candidatus Dojkabacteria bacterium]
MSKINNILKNLKGEETQEPPVQPNPEVKEYEDNGAKNDKNLDNNGFNVYNDDS